MLHCHWWAFYFCFFVFFLQKNNKICLTATGGPFIFVFLFFFFKKITRYASLPLVGPLFLFFLQKNQNVGSNHHKLFYRWLWDKFLLIVIFLFPFSFSFFFEKNMFLSKFITNIIFYLSITHHISRL